MVKFMTIYPEDEMLGHLLRFLKNIQSMQTCSGYN